MKRCPVRELSAACTDTEQIGMNAAGQSVVQLQMRYPIMNMCLNR